MRKESPCPVKGLGQQPVKNTSLLNPEDVVSFNSLMGSSQGGFIVEVEVRFDFFIGAGVGVR